MTTPLLINYSDKIKHWSARKATVTKIILHHTAGTASSAINWFTNPKSLVSAHYIISRDGNILKCVDEHNCAWHSGVPTINQGSIGIELEAYTGNTGLTDKQDHTLVSMLQDMMIRYKIEPKDILLHRQVKITDCTKLIWPQLEDFDKWKSNHF